MKKLLIALLVPFAFYACKQIDTPGDIYGKADFIYVDSVHVKAGQVSTTSPFSQEMHIYNGEGPMDVVLGLRLLGNLSEETRNIKITQMEVENSNNATPYVHYVPFDEPGLATEYVLQPNQVSAKVNVHLLNPTVTKETTYILRFKLDENEFFNNTPGVRPDDTTVTLFLRYHPAR